MKPRLVNTCGSSSAMQIQKSRSWNYDIYKKCVFNYIIGLTMLKEQVSLLYA